MKCSNAAEILQKMAKVLQFSRDLYFAGRGSIHEIKSLEMEKMGSPFLEHTNHLHGSVQVSGLVTGIL